jgi:hypothetical protein
MAGKKTGRIIPRMILVQAEKKVYVTELPLPVLQS